MNDTYKHASGLDFDFGYLTGHDITVIMLYTGDDYEHDHIDPYFVGHWYGSAEDMTDDDFNYVINKWLANKTDEDIQRMLKMQIAFDASIQ